MDPAKIDRASVTAALRNVKRFESDMFCAPWYIGDGPRHNPNHNGPVSLVQGGKLVPLNKLHRLAGSGTRRRPRLREDDRDHELRSCRISRPSSCPGLATAATYVLAAVGIVVLYRASGVVNFAQGAVGALAAFVSWAIVQHGGPDVVGWIAGVLCAVALSLFYGRVLAPRLAYGDPVMRAVATLSFALILLGFIDYVWGEMPRKLRLPTDTDGFEMLGVRITYTRAVAFGIAVAATIAIMTFLAKSRLGLQMRALANNRDLSAMLGVRVLRADGYAWVISGALAGVSGILLADLQRLSGIALTFAVIPAIAAAVIGALRFTAGDRRRRTCDRRLRSLADAGARHRAVPHRRALRVRGHRAVVDAAPGDLCLSVSAP